jgi:hypothetical protein
VLERNEKEKRIVAFFAGGKLCAAAPDGPAPALARHDKLIGKAARVPQGGRPHPRNTDLYA